MTSEVKTRESRSTALLGHTWSMFRQGKASGALGALAVVAAVLCLASGSATALAGSGQLRAFERPARARDAIPSAFLPVFAGRYGPVAASRRIATGTGFRGHSAVYLARLKRQHTCLIQIIRDSSAGAAGCFPSREFLSAKQPVRFNEGGRFLYGIAANNVARVGFLDRRGTLHPVRVTGDNGFLYACRHHNGCVSLVSAVNGYDSQGRLVFHESLGQRPLP
jgi:hypothetical protein